MTGSPTCTDVHRIRFRRDVTASFVRGRSAGWAAFGTFGLPREQLPCGHPGRGGGESCRASSNDARHVLPGTIAGVRATTGGGGGPSVQTKTIARFTLAELQHRIADDGAVATSSLDFAAKGVTGAGAEVGKVDDFGCGRSERAEAGSRRFFVPGPSAPPGIGTCRLRCDRRASPTFADLTVGKAQIPLRRQSIGRGDLLRRERFDVRRVVPLRTTSVQSPSCISIQRTSSSAQKPRIAMLPPIAAC